MLIITRPFGADFHRHNLYYILLYDFRIFLLTKLQEDSNYKYLIYKRHQANHLIYSNEKRIVIRKMCILILKKIWITFLPTKGKIPMIKSIITCITIFNKRLNGISKKLVKKTWYIPKANPIKSPVEYEHD